MKKINLLLSGIALLAISQTMNAQTIVGSQHDFSQAAYTWNTSGEICKVCHTPHNAMSGVVNAPLWNHSVSAVATYTLYNQAVSATLNATVGQPDGSSKLCLSCHDGTVALENFGGVVSGTHNMTGANLVGTDLSNDHPISFTYDNALATADGGLKNPTTATGVGTATIQNSMLIGNKMQCSSCHDVHNKYGLSHLLVKSNSGSALCLTCHSK